MTTEYHTTAPLYHKGLSVFICTGCSLHVCRVKALQAGLRTTQSVYFEGPSPLARFSLVSAASFRACITRAFLCLVSSILNGFDSGRF